MLAVVAVCRQGAAAPGVLRGFPKVGLVKGGLAIMA